MKKIGIIYGSSTGTCQSIAESIAEKLGVSSDNLIDVGTLKSSQVGNYEVLLLGSSTWGDGEMQDDWYDGVKVLKEADLSGKTVALFGCGDGDSYEDTFCDAMAVLKKELEPTGCKFIGEVSTDGYSCCSSDAVVDGKFVGLALDDVNESSETEGRIDAWISSIMPSLS